MEVNKSSIPKMDMNMAKFGLIPFFSIDLHTGYKIKLNRTAKLNGINSVLPK